MRNISGIYFREGKENICFEELEPKRQREILEEKGEEFAISLALQMSSVVKRLGEEFGISVLFDSE